MDKTLVSAGVRCYINGKNIGWVTGVNFSESTPRKAVKGIDTPVTFEYVTTGAEISGSVSVIKLYGDDSLEYRGIVAGLRSIIREKYFSLMLVQQNAAGASYVLFRADECVVEGQSWNAQARGIVSGTFNFKGIEAVNAATETEHYLT